MSSLLGDNSDDEAERCSCRGRRRRRGRLILVIYFIRHGQFLPRGGGLPAPMTCDLATTPTVDVEDNRCNRPDRDDKPIAHQPNAVGGVSRWRSTVKRTSISGTPTAGDPALRPAAR